MSELKPCPFCGGEAELRTRKDNAIGMDRLFYRYRCKKCHATVGSWSGCISDKEWSATNTWNRRAEQTERSE